MLSPLMGEFIYAGRPWPVPFGPVFACSNPLPADLVFCTDKRNRTKEKPPRCAGLRLLCALQSGPGTVNSGYALRQALRFTRPSLPVLDNQKGKGRSKTKDKRLKAKDKIRVV